MRKLPFLFACISPGPGGLISVKHFQRASQNMSLNISEICFNLIYPNVIWLFTISVSTRLFSQGALNEKV